MAKALELKLPEEEENEKYLIDKKDNRNKFFVIIEFLITIILTAMLWIFLVREIIYKLTAPLYAVRTEAIAEILFLSVFVILVLYLFWQGYNYLRFRGKDRRKVFPRQSIEAFGELYGIDGLDMLRLQAAQKGAVIRFADNRYYFCLPGANPIEIKALAAEN